MQQPSQPHGSFSWARPEADLSLLCATFHGKALGHMVGRPEREAGYEYLLGPISRAQLEMEGGGEAVRKTTAGNGERETSGS